MSEMDWYTLFILIFLFFLLCGSSCSRDSGVGIYDTILTLSSYYNYESLWAVGNIKDPLAVFTVVWIKDHSLSHPLRLLHLLSLFIERCEKMAKQLKKWFLKGHAYTLRRTEHFILNSWPSYLWRTESKPTIFSSTCEDVDAFFHLWNPCKCQKTSDYNNQSKLA